MRDVAALAGVAMKTVSRVVNGVATVDPDLAARVTRAARQLNYRPNLAAGNLRRLNGRSGMIGLLLEDVSNPFSAALLRAVEDVARPRGVAVLAASLDEDPLRERQIAVSLIDRRVDGLIIVPAGTDHSYLQDEISAGTAVVFADRLPSLLAADAVIAANTTGAADGVAHLIQHGHQRIAFLGDYRSITTAQERFDGYSHALRDHNLRTDDRLVRHELHTASDAESATIELLQTPDPPTAIFASQNLVTLGAIRGLRRLDAHKRVALVGFDDFPLADLLEPGITTVAQDPTGIGLIAASTLFRRLDHEEFPVATIVVQTRLLARGSGEIPPPESGGARTARAQDRIPHPQDSSDLHQL